ncbi:MAG: hypothetical protein M3N15_07995, partial [Actinomycetota bacterium]|nr:hypothetical protein [Actinomycetota bacterium]
MLVLISFGLVLVATVLLVFGLVAGGTGLTLIYISIACSVLAGIVLVVATVTRRPREEAATPATSRAWAPEPETAAAPSASAPAMPEPRPEPTAAVPASAAPTYTPARREPVLASVGGSGGGSSSDADDADDDGFPIEDYDRLRVTEILPLLPELYQDELDMVEERERSGKGRVRVLNRIEELRRQPVTEDVEVAPDAQPADAEGEAQEVPFFPIADYDELTVGEILPLLPELYDDELDMVEARERSGRGRLSIINRIAEIRDEVDGGGAAASDETPAGGAAAGAAPDDEDQRDVEFFPIADYDELTVGEILPLLPELYDDELDVVEDRERATKNRAAILSRLAELREQAAADEDIDVEEPVEVPAAATV